MKIEGKVWKFGDNISTDYLAPSFGIDQPWDVRKKGILHIHKTFTQECKPGDAIIAGKNFGCGSSREWAASNLKKLGISLVAADSFGRIFFRNCIAIALPVIECRGVSEFFEEGDKLEAYLKDSLVKNITKGTQVQGAVLPDYLLKILSSGGLLELLKIEAKMK